MTIAKQLREEGQQQTARKIAIKLLEDSFPVHQVAQLTELPEEIVNTLKNEKEIVN